MGVQICGFGDFNHALIYVNNHPLKTQLNSILHLFLNGFGQWLDPGPDQYPRDKKQGGDGGDKERDSDESRFFCFLFMFKKRWNTSN